MSTEDWLYTFVIALLLNLLYLLSECLCLELKQCSHG